MLIYDVYLQQLWTLIITVYYKNKIFERLWQTEYMRQCTPVNIGQADYSVDSRPESLRLKRKIYR